MSYPACPPRILPKALLPDSSLLGPHLNVVVAESEICDHVLLTTFIDDEFVGIYVEKNGTEVFSFLKDFESVIQSRKDR